jgi:hypothetical protein
MVDVRVAGDQQNVELVPTAQAHLLAGSGQKRGQAGRTRFGLHQMLLGAGARRRAVRRRVGSDEIEMRREL